MMQCADDMQALEWFYGIEHDQNRMCLIIHELTGVMRSGSQLWSHIDGHKTALKTFFPITYNYALEVDESLYRYRNEWMDPLEDIDKMIDWIKTLQVKLSDLLGAYNRRSIEHGRRLERPLKKGREYLGRECLDFPAVTPNAKVFRKLSENVSSTAVHCNYPLKSLLSVTLVNHQIRAEALALLASRMLYDFDDTVAFHHYTSDYPSTFQDIKHIRITFVEGSMRYRYDQEPTWERDPDAFFTQLNEHLPKLSDLYLDIWPRKVREAFLGHEAEEANNPWGPDTERLLDSLGKARLTARTVLEFRWQHDCERFEKEWMDKQGWICLGSSDYVTEETSP